MTFFNKKEEVLEVVLTRVGREKLATGQFIPTHYEFLDEDVLYDVKNLLNCHNSNEEQNDIKARIKDKISIRPPTAKQAVFSGDIKTNKPRKENRLIESLGTFSPYAEYKPSWNIRATEGTLFTSSVDISYIPLEIESPAKTACGPSYEKIPQLHLTCSYNYNFYTDVDKSDPSTAFYDNVVENPFIEFKDIFKNKDDNSFILFQKDFNDFTIKIKEENVLSASNQFELEVFKYNYVDDFSKVELQKLFFGMEDITKESVEWYFNISTDQDIEEEKFIFIDEKVDVQDIDDECI